MDLYCSHPRLWLMPLVWGFLHTGQSAHVYQRWPCVTKRPVVMNFKASVWHFASVPARRQTRMDGDAGAERNSSWWLSSFFVLCKRCVCLLCNLSQCGAPRKSNSTVVGERAHTHTGERPKQNKTLNCPQLIICQNWKQDNIIKCWGLH